MDPAPASRAGCRTATPTSRTRKRRPIKGYLKETSPGHFRIAVYVGRGPAGEREYRWRRFRGSAREARVELNKLLGEAAHGRLHPNSVLTVAAYFKRWLAEYAKHRTSAGTYRRYEQRVNGMIVPALGDRRLTQLKPAQIQSAYARWLESGRLPRKHPSKSPSKPGLSTRTVVHAHRLMHVAFKTAVRWGLLPANPIDAVTPPRVDAADPRIPDERSYLAFLRSIADTRMAVPVMLAATTGLRLSEIVGLNWADVDLKAGVLSVKRGLERVGGADREKPTKTKRSRRRVPLPKVTIAALRSLKADQKRWASIYKGAYFDCERVCVHENGRPWTLNGLSSSYRKAAAKASFDSTFHGLRHGHATWLLRAGVHPRIVAERLGHSSTLLTMDTYSHVLPGMQDTAVAALDRVFKGNGIAKGLPARRKTLEK